MVNNNKARFNIELKRWATTIHKSVEKWLKLKYSKVTLLLSKRIIILTSDLYKHSKISRITTKRESKIGEKNLFIRSRKIKHKITGSNPNK